MSESTALDLVTERRLIFSNLLNGCDYASVGKAFNKTEKEIDETFNFVIQLLKSVCFENRVPLPPCGTLAEAQANRLSLLKLADKVDLTLVPVYKNVITAPLESIL